MVVGDEPYISIALLFIPFPTTLMITCLHVENVELLITACVILNCCGWE